MTQSSEQLLLPLPLRSARGRDDFFVAKCNALAVQQLDDWQNWPHGKLALIGPAGSGKTHLAHVWAAQSGAEIIEATAIDAQTDARAVVVEGADKIAGNAAAQEQLFHLHNALNASKRSLLITGQTPPSRWRLELPDLVSRLLAIQVTHLELPDDSLLSMIMVKLFADRQVNVGPDLISFLVKRMGRSYTEAITLVETLDQAAFSSKRPLTARFAAQILAKQ